MQKLTKKELLFTILYMVVHLVIGIVYFFEFLNREYIKYYFVIGLIFVFLVYDVFNKMFRKKMMLLTWSIIGIFQIVLYFIIQKTSSFQMENDNYENWLWAIPITILVLLVFNYINKRIYGDYFIVTMFRINGTESFDDRELRPSDYLFSFAGFMIILVSIII